MGKQRQDVKGMIVRAAGLAKEAALETLWPTRCALCDVPGELICKDCRSVLAFIDANDACPRCGAPFGCRQCTECNDTMLTAAGREGLPVTAMASVLLADEGARRIVTTYKDGNERRLAPEMARLIPSSRRNGPRLTSPTSPPPRRLCANAGSTTRSF